MARRYTLDTKIHALNQLDKHSNDMQRIADELSIPVSTLQKWRTKASKLRSKYRRRNKRLATHLKSDLQVAMLDKSMAILQRMDDDTLDNAPLNQLASALGALVNHAMKLEEALEEDDEQEEQEQVIRFEFVSDGRVTETPPWTEDSPEESGEVQDSSVRETVGEDTTGENQPNDRSRVSRDAWLVASPDLPDVEPSLARFEDGRSERDWYYD